MSVFTVSTDLVTLNCSCGGVFAITESFRAEARKTGKTWPCPYCEGRWNDGESDNTKLKRRLEDAQRAMASAEGRASRACEEADRQTRRASAARGQVTKIKNRVGRGVCPCCNRTFADLARHMESQHPEFTEA